LANLHDGISLAENIFQWTLKPASIIKALFHDLQKSSIHLGSGRVFSSS